MGIGPNTLETIFPLSELPRTSNGPCCQPSTCGVDISDAVVATGAMGCRVMCEAHFLAYHKAASIAEVVEREQKRRAVKHVCARCGRPARWISGAGQALCVRHCDDY